jgi:hypothetical protein
MNVRLKYLTLKVLDQVIPFVKIRFDFQSAFNEEFERTFHPIDYFFIFVRNFYVKDVAELKKSF